MVDEEVEKMSKSTYSIFGEIESHDRALIMNKLSFARIIDDIIVPFETGKPFFIDGVPVTKEKIRKIKIIRETYELKNLLEDLHRKLRQGTQQIQKDIADQYYIRVEAILREKGEDVTSQVIKAFEISIRPRLKDYLPNRQELIQAALVVFTEALKALGSRNG
jgi:hypothetical protein